MLFGQGQRRIRIGENRSNGTASAEAGDAGMGDIIDLKTDRQLIDGGIKRCSEFDCRIRIDQRQNDGKVGTGYSGRCRIMNRLGKPT